MRPHVELIQEDDYVWHGAELPGGEGRASERRLSVDEEDGSSSLRVDFHTDWGRGPGIHHANTEYYVARGRDRLRRPEDRQGRLCLRAHRACRWTTSRPPRAPRSCTTASTATPASTRSTRWPVRTRWADAREDVIVLDTEAMKWDAVPNPGPMPGLFIKYLHVDPVSGFYTRLVHAQEGWSDHRLAHHPCYEEAYTTQGHMEYNFGTLDLGTYFFRPARVKHGHFTTMEGGATWLLRSDGELANWYTQNEWVRWGGEAVNYGPNGLDEAPHPAVRWAHSTHDMAQPWRTEEDMRQMTASWQFQVDQGQYDAPVEHHGSGFNKADVAIAKALDAFRLQGGHGGQRRTRHDHSHDGRPRAHARARRRPRLGLERRDTEHADERTDDHAHNWGAGRNWQQGDPIPAPILSSCRSAAARAAAGTATGCDGGPLTGSTATASPYFSTSCCSPTGSAATSASTTRAATSSSPTSGRRPARSDQDHARRRHRARISLVLFLPSGSP